MANQGDLATSGDLKTEVIHHFESTSRVVERHILELNVPTLDCLELSVLRLANIQSGNLIDDREDWDSSSLSTLDAWYIGSMRAYRHVSEEEQIGGSEDVNNIHLQMHDQKLNIDDEDNACIEGFS